MSNSSKHSMELLAPAGGFEQLRAAIDFGADAVYLAAKSFGMRARAANFSFDELKDAVDIAHNANVKVHLTCNILILQHALDDLPGFFEEVQSAGVDALIIGDMGAFTLAKKYAPSCELHVSTQASVANSEAAKAWYELGAKRIVCAREMSLEDIAQMRKDIPDDLEIEAFVHGAQCMAVSGRCLISSYLTGRSGNEGHCTQPCRWKYTLEEEKRPGMHFPVIEDDSGSFIMNANDLCMIGYLGELQAAGIDSIKIEGRNKKAFYVANVTGAYRRAIDALESGEYSKDLIKELEEELLNISHRPYGTGFYFGEAAQADDFDGYEQNCIHVADVVECSAEGDIYKVNLLCRNKFEEGEILEAVSPRKPIRQFQVKNLHWVEDEETAVKAAEYPIIPKPVDVANRSRNIYSVETPFPIQVGSFIRAPKYRRSARHEG